jgi:transcription elongation regulator 1
LLWVGIQASWTDARPKLERDGLGRASNPDLDLPEREKLFREHVNDLYERCLGEYQALLADTITAEVATKQGDEGKTILTSWSEAKKVLKLDPCYGKVPHHERESLWRRYVEDMQRWLKGGRSSVLKHERSSVANTEGGKQSSGLRYTPSNRR